MSAKRILAVVPSLAVLALAAGASAASPESGSIVPYSGSISVSVADLNLKATDGGRIALRRIQSAAERICGGAPGVAELERTRIYRACMKDAIDHAVAALGSPVVAVLNAGWAGA